MLIVGVVTLFAWIALILSFFSLVQVASPIKRLSTSAYLGIQAIAITFCFAVLLLEGSILHAEYKYIKRRAEQKHADDDFLPFMNGSTTLKPTFV
ncbi:unnamed protein product [Gongylonema pulchrum]|uniref:Membrane-associating domain-containing protein n=1 Tax=Gongylonema pulchrum TaxID=637853 RepID=A0A183DT96_9BILA|nr:unnamed protein product [Gongylonema pulchrum]